MATFQIENARCTRKTDKAILVECDEDPINGEAWIPQSQVDDDSEVYKPGTDGTLIISEWWAKKQGWTE